MNYKQRLECIISYGSYNCSQNNFMLIVYIKCVMNDIILYSDL